MVLSLIGNIVLFSSEVNLFAENKGILALSKLEISDTAVSSDHREVPMPTIFELIVAGEIPCHKIWEDEDHLAFLDINPRIEGHTLVIPKKAWFEVFAMGDEPYIKLWSAAQTVARHLQEKTGCARVVIVVLGYEVEHVHIHLLPTNHLEDFPFPPVDQAALAKIEETAQKLRA
jgi:histidine triad (HIT) family protein